VTFLQNLRADLVDKKLWPVVAVLAVALVAVPLLLGGGGSGHGGAASVAAAPSAAAPGATAQVSLDQSVAGGEVDRPGRLRDPFAGQAAAKKAAAASTTRTSSSTSSSSPAAPASHAATPAPASSPPASVTAPAASAPTSSGTGAPAKPSADAVRKAAESLLKANDGATVRFSSDSAIGHAQDLRPMTALPSDKYPFVVFAGLGSDHKTAAFLVASGVRASGEGVCSPSPKVCQVVGLRKGQVAQFDYVNAAGHVKHYAMRLLGVHTKDKATGAATTASHDTLAISAVRRAATKAAGAAGR
jgi:hypothetical protein